MAISKSTPYVRYKENFTSNLHLGTIHVESEYLDRTQKTTIESIHGMTWHNKVVNENKELDLLSNLGFELTESKKEYFNVGEQRVSVDEIHGVQDIEPNEDGTYTYSVTSIEGEYAEIYDGLNHITSTSDGLDGNFEIVYDTDEEDITGSVVLDATMPNYTIEDSNIGELNDVVFKGETLVNILPQPSLRNKMENISMQRLNEGHDEVVVADGEYKSAILKGNTLVNIIPSVTPLISASDNSWYQLTESSPNNITLTVTGEYPTSWKYIRFDCFRDVSTLNRIKPNTKYLIKFDKLQNIKSVGIRTGEGKIVVAPEVKVIGNYAIVTTNNTWEVVNYILLCLTPSDGLQLNDRIICKNPVMIEYQDGMENWDIPYFEGMTSVKMPVLTTTGKNLINLGDFSEQTKNGITLSRNNNSSIKLNGGTSSMTNFWFNDLSIKLKPDTYQFLLSHQDNNITYFFRDVDGNNIIASKFSNSVVITEDKTITSLLIQVNGGVNSSNQDINIQLESGSVATEYEPYKSNILSSVKTFAQSMFEQGSFKESTPFDTKPYDDMKIDLSENSTYYSNRIRTITTHKVIPGASYKVKINDGYGIFIGFCKNGLYSKLFSNSWSTYYNFTFTVPTDCDEMFFALRKIDNSDITVEDYPAIGLEIRQEVTLRGIGDVKDELNLLTGELTQRIGEVVLDGSESGWSVSNNSGTNTILFQKTIQNRKYGVLNMVCDSLKVENVYGNDEEGILGASGINYIYLRVFRNKLNTQDVNGLKLYLQSNPITVQYQLATESIKTVDLTVTDQDNVILEIGKPLSYKDGHIQVQSNGILPSSISYEVPSQNHIHADMLKPSNTYTLKRNGENFEGSFFIDGTEYNTNVFMTSHQLPNKSLIINDMGEHDKVAMFEGNYGTSTIPYFEGMSSVKQPVLTTTGKNLFNYFDLVAGELIIGSDSNNVNIFEDGWYKEETNGIGFILRKCIKVKPNTVYYANFPQTIHFIQYKANGDLIKGNYPIVSTGCVSTSSEAHYINLLPLGGIAGWDEAKRQEYQNCYISESEAMTPYEPYKSNILTTNEEVTLRAIGDVKDEYNVETGELTQRIGEVVFDGSEDWTFYNTNTVNTISFSTILEKFDKAICDKFNYEISRGSANAKDEECYTCVNEGEKITKLYIYISKQKANDVESFKQYLQSNPITVQYQLAQPTTRKVTSTILDQDGKQTHSIHTYTGLTNLSTSSDTLIPNVSLDYEISSSTGTVTGTSATIENGENGSPISAIVYGESLVNSIQEPSDVEYVVLGEHSGNNITIENSVEGNIENAVVKGRTLINLAQPSLRAWTLNPNSDTASLKATTEEFIIDWSKGVLNNAWIQARNDNSPVFGGMLKADTDYTFIIRILENNPTFEGVAITGNVAILQMWGLRGYHPQYFALQAGVTGTIVLKYKFNRILTTQDIENLFGIAVEGTALDGTKTIDGGKLRISKDIIILEGDYTNNYQDIPYFEGMGSVKQPVLTTTGKNLIDKIKTEEGYLSNDNPYSVIITSQMYGERTTEYIKVKPNTTYTYTLYNLTTDIISETFWNGWYYYKNIGEVSSITSNRQVGYAQSTCTFTTPSDCNYIRISSRGLEYETTDVMLSEDTSSVPYEPYQTNTLTINEPIELRGIGDVKDELDLVTGKLTQRIGEIVLNGSEEWEVDSDTDNYKFAVALKHNGEMLKYTRCLCDKIRTETMKQGSTIYNYLYIGGSSINLYENPTMTLDEFKIKLQQNPITLQYQLATPTTKTIDLTVTDQDGNPTSLHSYNDTTHIATNSQGLIANVEISNPSYDVVLKTNTKYTLKLNRTNVPTDTPLEINLGGTEATMDSTVNSIAITTPSTLANNKLTMSGLGNKFKEAMVIEGDCVDRDLDYFEGIVGVENPILTTTGKNIFKLPSSDEMLIGEVGKYIKLNLKPNTDYVYNSILDKKGNTDSFNLYGWISNSINDNYGEYCVFHWNANETFSNTFNTGNDVWYFHLLPNNRVGDYRDYLTFQLEEGTTATSYEPYKPNILTTYPQITLHSIGDIKDELDLVNETVTRRIGEVVLNGSEDWRVESGGSSTHTRFSMRRGNNIAPISNITFEQYKCNRFRAVTAISGTVSEEVMLMENYDNYFISLVVKNTRLSTPDAEGLKTWLSQNPTTVIYLIAPTTESVRITPPNPQTSTASVTLSTQLGESDYATWNPYKEHYVHYNYEQDGSYTWDNLTDLNERQFIELYDRRTYVEQEYKNTFLSHDSKGTSKYVLIEPNQDYTVTVRFSELPQCETVKVNLGGSEVEMNVSDPRVHVTTPSTLSNYLCSISGKGLSGKITDILVIHCLEHEGFADIDYFEGIDSIGEVVDGKASIIVEQTNGNLIDKDFEVHPYQNGNGIRLVDYIDVRPNKKYIFKAIKNMSIEQLDKSLNRTFTGVYNNGSELHTDINTAKVMISAANTYSNGNGSTHRYHPIELCLKGMEKDYIRPRYNSSQEIILPMQLCRINTVYDNFYYDVIRGHYRIQQSIGHKYFTGADNENWTLIERGQRILRFRYNNADIQIKSLGEYMTNRFTNGTATSPYESCAFNGTTFIISIDKERLSNATLAAFKEWLSSHNVHLYYQLAIPMMIDLPQYSSKLELNTYKDEIYTFLKNCKPTVFTLDVPLDQTYRFYELQESQGYTNRIELTDERMTEEDALYINTIYGSGISNLIEEPNNVNTLLKPNYEGRATSHTLTNGKVSTIGVHGFEPNGVKVGAYNTVTKQYELTVKATSGENNNSVAFPIPYALEQYEDGTHDMVYYNSQHKQWMFEGGQTLTVAYNSSTGAFTNAIEIFRGMTPRSGMIGEFKVKFASGTTSARLYYSLDGSTYTYTTLRSMTDGDEYYIAFFNNGGTKIDMGTKIGANSKYTTLVPLSGTMTEALMINQIQSITECTYYLDKTYYYTEPTRPIELTVYEGTNTITENNGAIITIKNNAHNKDALIYANTPYTVYWTHVGGEGNIKVTLGGTTQEVAATQGYVTITTSDADLERGLLIGGFDVTIKDLMLVKGERIADLSYFEGSRAVGTAFIDEDGNTMYRITLVTGSELIQDKFEDVITFEDNKKHNVLVTKLLGTKPNKN